MPLITASVECQIRPSFRVDQIRGIFGLGDEAVSRETFTVEVPGDDEDWEIGAVTGPSGSGKSTVTRKAFGDVYRREPWPDDAAIVDGFPQKAAGERLTIDRIHGALTAVGFHEARKWCKPYRVLSDGEKFRADMARALLSEAPAIEVCDNFTDPLDRTVACSACVAIEKSIRDRRLSGRRRLVVVSPHRDFIEWLRPNWVLDMSTKSLARGWLQSGWRIELEVFRCKREAFELFNRHHYLDHTPLNPSAQLYLATWDDRPVAICVMLNTFGAPSAYNVSRVVASPDFQGRGIGMAVAEHCCQIYKDKGVRRVSITASHPAVHRHCERSPLWLLEGVKKFGNKRQTNASKARAKAPVVSAGRPVVTFEYIGRSSHA